MDGNIVLTLGSIVFLIFGLFLIINGIRGVGHHRLPVRKDLSAEDLYEGDNTIGRVITLFCGIVIIAAAIVTLIYLR